MDNNEQTQEPVGDADVTASQDNSGDVTQTAETVVEPTNEGVEDKVAAVEGNPWDNDPKFKGKSPADVYNSYKEVEKLTGELGNKAKIATMLEEKYGMNSKQIEAMIQQEANQREQQQMQKDPGGYALEQTEQLRDKVRMMEEEKALDSFIDSKPEYKSFRDKILRIGLTAETDKPYDQIAEEYFGGSITEIQRDAYNRIETKQQTQATGVSAAAPKGAPSEDDMANMSSKELEAILPHAPSE